MYAPWLALLMVSWAPVAAQNAGPFDVGGRAQLFVDRVLVQSSENVTFTLHRAEKHSANPLIRSGRPEDGNVALCGSVLFDQEEGLFKMWYLARNGTTYATSLDGLKWETHGDVHWPGYMFASVWKDREEPDPARRYKIIAWSPNAPGVLNPSYDRPVRTAYNTSVSPDGKKVARLSEQPICPKGDVITGYYDRRHRLYVAFPKTGTQVRGFNRRCFSIVTSKDFVTWTEPKLAFVPDELDDAGAMARAEEVRSILVVPPNPKLMRTEFYGIGVYQHESCTLAFPWLFTVTGSHNPNPQEGPGEIQLAVSRDLAQWDRPFRTPAIPRGKPGEWDGGFFETAAEAFRVGDEIRLYYMGTNRGHGIRWGTDPNKTRGIGLATWKLDRFVSADAGDQGGTLTTVPVVFAGNRLELNGATARGGEIAVEILDGEGRALGRSRPFSGDELRHRVQWTEPVDLAGLAGKPVRLRFHLRSAGLYAFAFRE